MMTDGEDFVIHRQETIGKGLHSHVYKFDLEGRIVAGKVSSHPCINKEYDILKKLNHSNIIEPIYSFMYEDKTVILQELCINFLNWRACNKNIRERGFISLINQLGSAIVYIHSKGIIHCDIKASNLLISTRNGKDVLMVSDFSSSVFMYEERKKIPSFTETHCAWELINNVVWDERIDTWSMGCCIFEMVYNKLLFHPSLTSKNGKISKKNIKSYNNMLLFWAFYTNELELNNKLVENAPFPKANVPPGMKYSKCYHDVIIISLLKVFPKNRKYVSDVFSL
jgi:serine/threonine protein kinase